MELVEAFSFLAEPPKRSILILATDGEEKGLVGSKYWAAHPTVPIEKVVAAINMDMIGRLRDDKLYIYGSRTGAGLRRLISEQNDELRMNIDFSWQFVPNSDAYPLFEKGVPALLFHTGLHENYHRTSDTPEKLNAPGMSRVVRLAFCLANELAERPERIACRPGAKREGPMAETLLTKLSPPPPTRLGVALDSAASGDLPGVRIAKVDADSPAALAGLKEGDRILEFAGREVQKSDDLIRLVMTAESPAKAVIRSPQEENSHQVRIDLSGHALHLGITWRIDEAEPKALDSHARAPRHARRAGRIAARRPHLSNRRPRFRRRRRFPRRGSGRGRCARFAHRTQRTDPTGAFESQDGRTTETGGVIYERLSHAIFAFPFYSCILVSGEPL